MKPFRHGRCYTSGALIPVMLLAIWNLLASPANAAGTLTFVVGELQRQVYTNLPGDKISDLVFSPRFPDSPDVVDVVNAFETPTNSGDNYGERLMGFLMPPVTGDYVFYLSSDDQSVLFLSPDANPTNKVQIAVESNWSFPRSWTGTGGGRINTANISAPVHLEAGQKYYVEALHKEAAGGDSFGVAWQMPGELPPANGSPAISGQYLGREGPGLPNLSFQLAFFSGSGPSTGEKVFFRNYTTAGPQPGAALLPGMRVVSDAEQRYYYTADGRQVLKVDSQTGTAEAMVPGQGVPAVSWPMGMTFDPTRNRVLLATLGGEGFLYAYTPENSQWSVVASMQDRDVDSVVYHARQDALYALELYRAYPFGPRLYRLSATGAYQSEIQLPALPWDVGVASYQSELVSVGDYLFLLLGPDPVFPYGTGSREERLYLIDPRSGQVWLTYQRVIPPPVAPVITQQPASQSIWAGDSVTFTVTATGMPLPDYQWQFNGQPIPGGTAPTLTLSEVQVPNAGVYSVVVSNPAGSVTSQPATLKVLSCVLRPAPGGQEKPAVASNGSLYLVVWADARGTNGWDIYGTRVSPQGRVLDPDGIPICTLPQMQGDPAVASDGRDFLVAWNDARDNTSAGTSYDIYGARVTAEGRVLEPNGFPICRAPAAQFYPAIAFNGTNYLLAWYDYRNSDAQGVRNDIYGARVSPQGVVLDPNGLAFCTADDMQWAPGVASWGGEFFVAWSDSRRGLYGARVTDAGAVLPPNGNQISPNFSGYPIRVAANPTGYLVVWTGGRDYQGSGNNIYGRRISFFGTPLATNDLVLSSAPNIQVGPAVTACGNDFLAVWLDDRNGPANSLVCATRIGASGVLDPAGIPVGRSASSSSLNLPAAASLNGQYLVVWVGGNSDPYGATDICAARLRPDGTLLDTNSLLLSTVSLEVPVITWPAPAPLTYGHPLSSQQLNASANTSGSFVYNPPLGTLLGVGTGQVLSVTFTPYDTARYAGATASRTIDVLRAPLTITADDKSKRQGQPNPPLTATYSGFVAGDTPASLDTPVILTTTATLDSPPGNYPINASNAKGSNYVITYVPGTLRVLPELEITVPPFSQTRFVSQTATFAVQAGGSPPFSYQWCFLAAPIPGATAATLSLPALQFSNAGPYSVIVASSSGSVTSPPARLTVLARPTGPGSLDITFDPTAGGQLIGPTLGKGRVKSLALQRDGKLLVGGSFAGLQGQTRNNLARLQPDGSLDQSFSPGFGTDGSVDDIAVQPDGRILIAGAFTRFNGEPRFGIARLYPDGSLDASFHPAVGGYPVACLALQSDGKILIGGSFTNVCGVSCRALARLNPDGTLDAGFDAASVVASAGGPWVAALALQPDGKVLVAGQFATALDQPLARLNPDGSPDSSFLAPQIRDSGIVGWVNCLALEPSGRILIGGHFLSVNGTTREGLARLNADGALDATFHAGPLGGTQDIGEIVLQPDGKVLIGGSFLAVNGIVRRGLARLNADGAVDLSFDPADAIYAYASVLVNDLVLDSVGRVVVASGLSDYWARSPHPLCRCNPNGSLDSSFLEPVLPQAGSVGKVAVQADGKVLALLPEQASFNGQPCGPVVRLRADGTLDPTFVSPLVDGILHCVLVQPDGKILLGGSRFLLNDDTEFIGVIRLNSDGSFDTAFQTDSPGDYSVAVYSLALQPDGCILVNGVFDTIRRVERSFVARLNPNGSVDESFQLDPQLLPSVGEFEPPIDCVAVQPDGKIFLGGWFGFDETVPRLVRLNADGSLDRDLLTPSQTGGVEQMIVQPDGKLLLAGRFNFTDDTQWQTVVRLQADGTLDTVFPSAFNWASSLALQPDGKVLVTVVGEALSLVRYHADGRVDSSFAPDIRLGTGTPSLISVVVQPNGQVLVAGNFSSVSGLPWYGLARLNNELVRPLSFVTRQLPGQHGSPGPTVQLIAQPSGTVAVYALQDQPPVGWKIANISHGGVFDAITGKVKFGPFFDHDARTLSYDVFPPLGFVGVGVFAGLASADGASSPIAGDDRMLIASLHPADYNPGEWIMRLDKVTAYAAAWRTGGVWALPPNPVPIDYVSRAAALWRGGESYVLDYNAGAPPLCWVNGPALPGKQAMQPDDPVTVLRRVPKGYLAGETFEVAIEVSARSSTLAYAIEEAFPAGWRIQNISHGGAIDTLHSQIKWGPFCDATSRTLRYQMVPSSAAGGPISFLGSASFDGANTPISGPAVISSTSRLIWTSQPEKGRCVLQLKGDRNARYLVETSADLVQWTPLTVVTNSLGQVEIPAPVTSQSQLYYRAKLVTAP